MNLDEIINGARTAFIDEAIDSSSDFRPKLLYNNEETKVINSIKDELKNCDEFIISSAFITMGGITPLLSDFEYLENHNIRGKILTTDYLNFTEPKALRKLQEFKNIQIKLYSQEKEGFHTKGYIFKKDNVYKGIVGSSNLTMNALTINKEWNVEFTSLDEGEMLLEIKNEFNRLWDEADDLEDVLPVYEKIYDDNRRFTDLRKINKEIKEKNITLTPNIMQEDFLNNLRTLIRHGEDKAILDRLQVQVKPMLQHLQSRISILKGFYSLFIGNRLPSNPLKPIKTYSKNRLSSDCYREIQRIMTKIISSPLSRQCPRRTFIADFPKTISTI